MAPRVSIVIPTYNKVELTLPCLESLATHTPEDLYEVVIVDNASSDGTRDLLAQLDGDVTVVLNNVNTGFGPACNAGAARASGEYVLFLNNDTQVTPGWLSPLIAALDQDPKLAAVQPRLLFPDGRINDAGGLFFANGPWTYGKHVTDPSLPQFSKRYAPDYASGACLLVRKSMFDAVGGFDDRYAPAYFEDTDLSFAFRSRGWKVLYEPHSTVFHIEGGSSGGLTSEFKNGQMERNQRLFHDKWAAELAGRPTPLSVQDVDAWAHRDQGALNPLPYETGTS